MKHVDVGQTGLMQTDQHPDETCCVEYPNIWWYTYATGYNDCQRFSCVHCKDSRAKFHLRWIELMLHLQRFRQAFPKN